jgi:hypothetical protein
MSLEDINIIFETKSTTTFVKEKIEELIHPQKKAVTGNATVQRSQDIELTSPTTAAQ